MTDKRRSEREPHRVSAGFGQRAVELAASVGKTKQDLMEAADLSLSTINRLIRGDGSPLSAIQIKNVLRSWGVDVSSLPSVDADDEGPEPMEDSLREGVELVKRLYHFASDEKYRYEVDRLRRIVDAFELIAEGTDEHKRKR